ncbi:hypothetical protein [Olleya sp. Bg11-27]|uniref:hypothetical protein n=1 Tax=Olleya sp. Bg11-27 TaxID=2058135 RepID=UPI000C30C016|nr:hypothetical protein [Olleya sp. Bg11-27]AUC75767.1 hypothetical protein CW732_08790 [Olleya sp. Bg11-27]
MSEINNPICKDELLSLKEAVTSNPNFFLQWFIPKKSEEVKAEIEEKETESTTHSDSIKDIANLVSSIKIFFEEEIEKNKEIQKEFIEFIRGNDEPSVDLTTFFKKYNYEIKPFFKSSIEKEITSISEGVKDEKYIDNLKLIIKNKDKKLVEDHKKYINLLGKDFLNKIKFKEDLSLRDQLHVSKVLGHVSSFVKEVTYYTPEETSNIEA